MQEKENYYNTAEAIIGDSQELNDILTLYNTLKANVDDKESIKSLINSLSDDQVKEITLKANKKAQLKNLNLQDTKEEQSIISLGAYKNSFKERITSNIYVPKATNIEAIDKITDGGFTNGSIIGIGGASGTGKSALALQIALNLAKERPVIYFSLEMSKDFIISRIISQRNFLANNKDINESISQSDILKRARESEKIQAIINKELNLLPSYLNDNLYIISPKPTLTSIKKEVEKIDSVIEQKRASFILKLDRENAKQGSEVLKLSEEEKIKLAKEKYQSPVIILDYLQLVQKEENSRDDIVDTIKKVNNFFQTYAKEKDTLTFLITAFNRDSTTSKGPIKQSDGRDTSDIEYSLSYYLGLNFRAYEVENIDKKEREKLPSIEAIKDEAKIKGFIPMTIKLLKSKDGVSGTKREIDFIGAYGYFDSNVRETKESNLKITRF